MAPDEDPETEVPIYVLNAVYPLIAAQLADLLTVAEDDTAVGEADVEHRDAVTRHRAQILHARQALQRKLDRLLLLRVLQHTGGNQLQAAKLLGITRGSVRTKLRELGISIGRTVTGSDDAAE